MSKVNKKEKPLNLNFAEPSEQKSLNFLLDRVNKNFKNQLLVDVQLAKEPF